VYRRECSALCASSLPLVGTVVASLRRPALAGGELVEPETRVLIHTQSANKKGRRKATFVIGGGGGNARHFVPRPSRWSGPSSLRSDVLRRRLPAAPCRTRYAASSHGVIINKKRVPFGHPFSIDGGGGGNRTRVRKPSATGSTCLSHTLISFAATRWARKTTNQSS